MTKRNPITRLVKRLVQPSQAQAQAQPAPEPEDDLEPTVKMHRTFIKYGD